MNRTLDIVAIGETLSFIFLFIPGARRRHCTNSSEPHAGGACRQSLSAFCLRQRSTESSRPCSVPAGYCV